jgi:hypothetical protein
MIIGYYGRSAPLGWQVCEDIEKVRRRVLVQLGHRPPYDHSLLVSADPTAAGGAMGFTHAYDVACAAFLDQQVKQLGDMDGSPSLHTTQTAIAASAQRRRSGSRVAGGLADRPTGRATRNSLAIRTQPHTARNDYDEHAKSCCQL